MWTPCCWLACISVSDHSVRGPELDPVEHVLRPVSRRRRRRVQPPGTASAVNCSVSVVWPWMSRRGRMPGRTGHTSGSRATRDSGRRTSRVSSARYATIALTRCPLEPGTGSFSNSHYPRSEGTFHVITAQNTSISAVDRGLEAFGRLDNSAIDQFELFRQVRARVSARARPLASRKTG
jgi:hypothetical protein